MILYKHKANLKPEKRGVTNEKLLKNSIEVLANRNNYKSKLLKVPPALRALKYYITKEVKMEEVKKRKAYKTTEQQLAAEKRYLENNPEAKKKKRINTMRSETKKFIREFATLEELKELEEMIELRKEELK